MYHACHARHALCLPWLRNQPTAKIDAANDIRARAGGRTGQQGESRCAHDELLPLESVNKRVCLEVAMLMGSRLVCWSSSEGEEGDVGEMSKCRTP